MQRHTGELILIALLFTNIISVKQNPFWNEIKKVRLQRFALCETFIFYKLADFYE